MDQERDRSPSIAIRPLDASDAAAFQSLRLRGLRECPEAFGSTYADESDLAMDVVARRLVPAAGFPASVVLGAFVERQDGEPVLAGLAGCYQDRSRKSRHKATLWGMYVAPEARDRGVGRRLVEQVLAEARTWPGVERVLLTVVERVASARRLYEAVGFREFARERDALRQDGTSDDMLYMSVELRSHAGDRGAAVE
jgi:GNAT superfamily N-acetyltransferase